MLGYVGAYIVDSACVHLALDQPAEQRLSAAVGKLAAAVEDVRREQLSNS